MIDWVLRALALHLLWQLAVAEPYEPPLPSWWNGGRVLTTEHVHIVVRHAVDFGNGVGLTIQLTTDVL